MGLLLLLPFVLIRFGLLALLNPQALRRAAHYPPLTTPAERLAVRLYQAANLGLVVALCFAKIRLRPASLFGAGLALLLLGALLLSVALVNFAAPTAGGLNRRGLYRLSRNPIYLAYFIYFLGCVLLTQSLLLLGLLLLFQITGHWLVLAEERWCAAHLGEEYQQYRRQVRRYL